MKNSQWSIIGILIFSITILMCHFLFLETLGDALLNVSIIGSAVILAFFIGYFMIYSLEKKDIYNMFTAILMPLMPVFALWLASSLAFPLLGYWLIALIPFLLIAASVGGVWAHKKRIKQRE